MGFWGTILATFIGSVAAAVVAGIILLNLEPIKKYIKNKIGYIIYFIICFILGLSIAFIIYTNSYLILEFVKDLFRRVVNFYSNEIRIWQTATLILLLSNLFLLFKLFTKTKKEDTFTDLRDGKIYKTTKIGRQIWMAENLNYEANGSRCYDNNPANIAKYGRLYTWEQAMKACPSGWHLPSNAEWDELITLVGGKSIAGAKLKATSGWNLSPKAPIGTDNYRFAALPGGMYSHGRFFHLNFKGIWWTSTPIENTNYAFSKGIDYDGNWTFEANDIFKADFLSVRYVKD
jgi:uncharacterized protein (TIGR02145 family)